MKKAVLRSLGAGLLTVAIGILALPSYAGTALSPSDMTAVYGGCANRCLSGQVCGVTTPPEHACGGSCPHGQPDCVYDFWEQQKNLKSCKPNQGPPPDTCARNAGTKEFCGYIYDCKCLKVGSDWMCVVILDPQADWQTDYFECN